MSTVPGGKSLYGFSLGIIMLDMRFPRLPGDVGNAHTWGFPVLYRVVPGALPDKVAADVTDEDLAPFLEAARDLEAQGVRAIALGCGFLTLFHERLKAAVNIPVVSSALTLLPLIHGMLPPGKQVGVMTVDSRGLRAEHFAASGAEHIPVVVAGLEDQPEFFGAVMGNRPALDPAVCREEHIRCAERLVAEHPEVGAILLECTNMPVYADDVRRATGLPVFDLTLLVKMVHSSLSPGGGGMGDLL